ncbi:acetate/propionate family kinase [Sulfurimonas sp.]|uniref:acetate/propionate family kinase n=1 Tax=Sulfurimonas sp. TaxID=2022749 RepID=UPI002627D4CB|nr:acetate/propionate family kinase [Sulfurimonas sp.]
MRVAVINSGSSTLKFKLFEMPSAKVLHEQLLEFKAGDTISQEIEKLDVDFSKVDVIGHRVVHGGEQFVQPVIIDEVVMEAIEALIPLAPLHNGANLAGIKEIKETFAHIPQVAVFDTAFHASLKKEAYLYALPYDLYEKEQIRRYGFHGSSHSYLLKIAAKKLAKEPQKTNIITLHLGNGASVCAIKNGKSIDTSMGFTPLEGLVMGTRSGDIDPAIVTYLERELEYSYEEVDTMLNKKSGLFGLCGESDVRTILNAADEKSKLAIDIMVRRIQKYIGAYMILLEDVDAIVFSGGIGEHSEYIRERVMDNKIIKNIKALVIETDEELEIANECLKVLKS